MILDGLSNTAAISEALVGNGTEDPLRTIWNTHSAIVGGADLEIFADKCLDPSFWIRPGDMLGRGRPWTDGNPGALLYNHVLLPNNAPCIEFRGTFYAESDRTRLGPLLPSLLVARQTARS